MSFIPSLPSWSRLLVGFCLIASLYTFFLWDISTNPPGFDQDECCISYTGYEIATTGRGGPENDTVLPFFFECGTGGYRQFASPAHPYVMALLFLFVPPSNLAARVFTATILFLSLLLLGLLAARISGQQAVGWIVAISGMVTPWLFEFSRFVLELFFFIFVIVLFLFCLFYAVKRERWRLTDSFFIALCLALLAYSYSSGRLMAPLFAFGLLIFAVDRRSLFAVLRTWVIYAITMIPLVVIYFTDSTVLTQRFNGVTNLSSDRSFIENISNVLVAVYEDLSPSYLMFNGDSYIGHHVQGMGELLVGPVALSILGVVILLLRRHISRWLKYILFATFVSLLPGAITVQRHYALRDAAFPIFLLLLMVPAISWLLGRNRDTTNESAWRTIESLPLPGRERFLRLGFLCGLMVLTMVQAVYFQINYRDDPTGGGRSHHYAVDFPAVFDIAVAYPDRPIYIEEGGDPIWISTEWYSVVKGVDLNQNFVHVEGNQQPQDGALVLTSNSRGAPPGSELVRSYMSYTLYRYHDNGRH